MSAAGEMLDRLNAVRDLETIPLTRGQLVQLLARVLIVEGMNSKQAGIHARMHVDCAFIQVKST